MNIFIIIFLVITMLIAILFYLVILGSSMNKSEEERMFEDQEQIEYLYTIIKISIPLWITLSMERNK